MKRNSALSHGKLSVLWGNADVEFLGYKEPSMMNSCIFHDMERSH